MAKEPELKVRDKVVVRMTREGAVEENLTAGTEQRVSKRLEDAELVKPAETAEPSEALSPEEQEKVQMRRQQRQFQAEHAEDNDTQPSSETSVTEEKKAEKQELLADLKNTELLCIDDVGTEPASLKVWGNEVSPLVDLLYHRYDRQLFTIITSNLEGDEDIAKRYGVRVADRFIEMFDLIGFDNSSYRPRLTRLTSR